MQLLEIMLGFTAGELNKLEQQLKNGFGKPTYGLFRELKKCLGGKREFNSKQVFKKIFDEPYSEEKDYKLKNEMRKLKSLTYNFLVDEAIRSELKEDIDLYRYYLSKSLAKRGILELFEAETTKALELAEKNLNYDTLIKLLNLETEVMTDRLFSEPALDGKYRAQLKALLHTEKKRVLNNIRDIELLWTEHLMVQGSRNIRNGIKGIDLYYPKTDRIDLSEVEDDWTRFKAYQRDWKVLPLGQDPERQLMLAQNGLALLNNIGTQTREQQLAQLDNMMFLSAVLAYAHNHEEALKISNDTFIFAESNKLELPATFYVGEMLNRAVLGRMEEVIEFYYQHQQWIERSDIHMVLAIHVCYAHLMLGRSTEALSFLRKTLDKLPGKPLVDLEGAIRFIYIIAFIVDRAYDDALRELDNFRKSKVMDNVPHPEKGKKMINIFRMYIRLTQEPNKPNRSKYKWILHELNSMNPLLIINSPVYRWLKHQLNIEMHS